MYGVRGVNSDFFSGLIVLCACEADEKKGSQEREGGKQKSQANWFLSVSAKIGLQFSSTPLNSSNSTLQQAETSKFHSAHSPKHKSPTHDSSSSQNPACQFPS